MKTYQLPCAVLIALASAISGGCGAMGSYGGYTPQQKQQIDQANAGGVTMVGVLKKGSVNQPGFVDTGWFLVTKYTPRPVPVDVTAVQKDAEAAAGQTVTLHLKMAGDAPQQAVLAVDTIELGDHGIQPPHQ